MDVTKEDFAREVLTDGGLVLVDWWGPRCVPCKALTPRLEELSAQYAGRVKFTKVNVEQNRRLAIEQKVMGLPTIQIYRDGKLEAVLAGEEARIDQVARAVERALSSEK